MGRQSMYDLLTMPTGIDDLPGIRGFEQGFNERSDVAVQAADGTDLNEYFREIQQVLALRNTQRHRLIDRLTFDVVDTIDSVSVPAQVQFEEASEYGQPKGIRGGAKFFRGYDFKFYDLAVRYTWMFLAEADRAQLENLTNMALDADSQLLFSTVMKCLFNPTNLVGVADNNIPVTVNKFYNNDGEVPPPYKNTTFLGTHNHYLGSNGATVTSANLDAMADHLIHHGFGVDNGTRLVLMVNRVEGAVIRTFRVTGGAKYDFIPSSLYGGGIYLPASMGIVARPEGEVDGEVGTYGPWHVVEDDWIPAGYMAGIATGGTNNLMNPVGLRQHKNPAYQGLKIIPGQRSDYPLLDSFYRRGLGTGIRQRGGGVMMQVVASTTYTVPAAYA